jgi:hypothetical protein
MTKVKAEMQITLIFKGWINLDLVGFGLIYPDSATSGPRAVAAEQRPIIAHGETVG